MSRRPPPPSNTKYDRCVAWQAHLGLDPSETSPTLDLRIYSPQDVNTYLPFLKKSPSAIIAPLHCWDDETVGAIIGSDPHLRSIALCGVWNAKMPQVVASFAYIAYLDMSNMQIRGGDLKVMIPAFSPLAKTLIYLDMSYNPICGLGVDYLAGMLSPLHCLEYLDVSHCQLSPEPPTNQSLPDLTQLAKSLSALTQLTHLNLSGNYLLGDVGSKKMGAALHHLTQLTYLDISWNDLYDSGCQALIQAMGTLPCLHTLVLNENTLITELGCKALAPLLTVPTLRHLELRKVGSMHLQDVNHLTYLDIQESSHHEDLGQVLGAQTNLKTLKMGRIQSIQFQSIGRFLQQQSQLERFELKHGVDSMADVVSALNMTTLTHLALEFFSMSDEHMRTLADNGPQLTQLQFLSFSDHYNITDLCFPELTRLLSHTPLLTHLNLGKCKFTPMGSVGLAQCLTMLPQLRFLSLELTHLLPTVLQTISRLTLLEDLNVAHTCCLWKQLGPTLQHLTNLTRLNLSQNNLTTKRVKLIAPSLLLLTRLTFLDLGNNAFETKGLTSLAVALAQMSHLQELHLYNCFLNDKSAKVLSKCMPSWKLLEKLDLACNQFGSSAIKWMTDSFGHLQSLHTLSLIKNQLNAKADKWLAKMLPLAPCLAWVYLANNDLSNADLVDLKSVWDADYDFDSYGVIQRK